MLSKAEMTRLLYATIGSPPGTGTTAPTADEVEQMTEYAFKSRVGLLFLRACVEKGVVLGPRGAGLLASLEERRTATQEVVVKLARRLDEVARGEWVLFKSAKPFASTPNDTDWFPLDPARHQELCDHLVADGGFELMEKAPRQTTLVDSRGAGITDTTKRGGIYYVDCYVVPSTDYFVYLDSRRLRPHVTHTEVDGYPVPVLAPEVELVAVMFHNVFPERSFSPESYYLVKAYLDELGEDGLQRFVAACRDHKVEYAAAANLTLVRAVDRAVFATTDSRVDGLLATFSGYRPDLSSFDPLGAYPYELPAPVFWRAFWSKQRDRTSRRSTGVQALHMLNPVFLADVVQIVWRRTVRGGVYEQN